MPAGNELGITQAQPYGGWSFYLSDAQYTENTPFAKKFADTFPRIRIITSYGDGGSSHVYPNNSTLSAQSWALALKSYKPSVYILYGVTSNLSSNTPAELSYFLPSAFSTYQTYLLAEAQWAQDNSMDAFCIGNENLISNSHSSQGMVISSLVRTTNVTTATFAFNHGLTTGDYIFVSGGNEAGFRIADSESAETVQCTVVNSTTVTYPNTGANATGTGTFKMSWSAYEVVRKTKVLAVACQAIFTSGPIVYTESQGHVTPWINLDITPGTDIDLIGYNGYGDGTNTSSNYSGWKAEVDSMWAKFNTTLIITEHNVVQDSGGAKVNNFNKNMSGFEDLADREIIKRYEYLKALGITQIYLFGTDEYRIFCNTYPNTTYNNAYLVGDFKPIVNKIKGIPVNKVIFGVNTLT